MHRGIAVGPSTLDGFPGLKFWSAVFWCHFRGTLWHSSTRTFSHMLLRVANFKRDRDL